MRGEHLRRRLDDSDGGRRAGVWLRIIVGAREPVRNESSCDDHAGRDADEGSTRSLLGLDRFHHDHDIIEVNRLGGGSRSVVWISATVAFAIIGCTWALSIARYGGPDEPAHVIRAAGAAHGDLVGKPVAGFEPGYRQVTVSEPLASGDPACFRHDETITAACAIATGGSGDVAVATSAGTAPPWYYVIVGFVARGLSSGSDVMGYRMAALLLCAAILGYAMARSHRRGGWLLVAITPSAWFLLGVVGTSGVEIALVALALVEAVNRFDDPPSSGSLNRVTIPLAICLLLRPAALIDVIVVALVLVPTLPRSINTKQMLRLAWPFAIVALATIAWSRWSALVVTDRRTADSDSLVTAFRRSVEGIPTTVHQAIGALGWNEFYAPVLAQVAWLATLGASAFWIVKRSRDRWWPVRWVVAALVLPTVVEVVIHTRIGEVWQGRYSIPFAMAGVVYAGRSPAPARPVIKAFVVAAALAEVLTLWQTLRRFMVGLDGSLVLRHATWEPPLNPWWLLVVNTAAIAWLGAVALGSGNDVAEDIDDVIGRPGVVV